MGRKKETEAQKNNSSQVNTTSQKVLLRSAQEIDPIHELQGATVMEKPKTIPDINEDRYRVSENREKLSQNIARDSTQSERERSKSSTHADVERTSESMRPHLRSSSEEPQKSGTSIPAKSTKSFLGHKKESKTASKKNTTSDEQKSVKGAVPEHSPDSKSTDVKQQKSTSQSDPVQKETRSRNSTNEPPDSSYILKKSDKVVKQEPPQKTKQPESSSQGHALEDKRKILTTEEKKKQPSLSTSSHIPQEKKIDKSKAIQQQQASAKRMSGSLPIRHKAGAMKSNSQTNESNQHKKQKIAERSKTNEKTFSENKTDLSNRHSNISSNSVTKMKPTSTVSSVPPNQVPATGTAVGITNSPINTKSKTNGKAPTIPAVVLNADIRKSSMIPILRKRKSAKQQLQRMSHHALRMSELAQRYKVIRPESNQKPKTAGPIARSSVTSPSSSDDPSFNIDNLSAEELRAAFEKQKIEKASLKLANDELQQENTILQKKLIKEQEKGKLFPKVTTSVPTSLEANIHLKYQYQKVIEAEREKYAALEKENQRLVNEMKAMEMKHLKDKKVMSQEERAVHVNEIVIWKVKVKELESEIEKLLLQINSLEKTIERDAKEKEKLQKELVIMKALQIHVSDQLDLEPVKPSPGDNPTASTNPEIADTTVKVRSKASNTVSKSKTNSSRPAARSKETKNGESASSSLGENSSGYKAEDEAAPDTEQSFAKIEIGNHSVQVNLKDMDKILEEDEPEDDHLIKETTLRAPKQPSNSDQGSGLVTELNILSNDTGDLSIHVSKPKKSSKRRPVHPNSFEDATTKDPEKISDLSNQTQSNPNSDVPSHSHSRNQSNQSKENVPDSYPGRIEQHETLHAQSESTDLDINSHKSRVKSKSELPSRKDDASETDSRRRTKSHQIDSNSLIGESLANQLNSSENDSSVPPLPNDLATRKKHKHRRRTSSMVSEEDAIKAAKIQLEYDAYVAKK